MITSPETAAEEVVEAEEKEWAGAETIEDPTSDLVEAEAEEERAEEERAEEEKAEETTMFA